ncbi:MAG: transposase, partial [Thermoplasmata archaeon]
SEGAINQHDQHPIEHFCCQIEGCPDRGKRGFGNLCFRGWGGHKRAIRMVYCKTCRRVFSERRGTAIEGLQLPIDKAISVLQHLAEGCGTRATARLVGVNKNTVTNYARKAGGHAKRLHDELVAVSPPHERGAARREVGLRREEGRALQP